MSKQIKVGVVGCGYWGPNLIRNFNFLPDCQLKTMCDLDEKRLAHIKSLYPGVHGEMDYENLLQDRDLDAMVIATSVGSHFRMAKASLQAGKHTMIEKPMASSVAECKELVDLARHKGLTLMVGHTFLYSAPVRKIKEILDTGEIGDIRYISSRRLNLGLFQKDINVAWDLAPHDLSIVLYIMGRQPISVNCWGNSHVRNGIEDVTNMSVNFPEGLFATIQSSWLDPRKVRDMTVVGTKKMIVYDDVEPIEKIKVYDSRVEVPPHYDDFGEFQYSYHYGDRYVPYLKQEEPLKVECRHFLDCIRSGDTPITSGQCGMEVVRILEASSQSLKRQGASIQLSTPDDDAEAVALSERQVQRLALSGSSK